MKELTSIFFELLQVADGSRESLSFAPDDNEWIEIGRIAYRQSMLGIVFYAIDRIPAIQCPSKRPLAKFFAESEKIRRQNQRFYETVPLAADHFASAGMQSILIKGQGLSDIYPDRYIRTPGDIDLWVRSDRKTIERFVRKERPDAKIFYHHIECKDINGCELEAHFTPSWMFNPLHNHRLQKWFDSEFERLKDNHSPFCGDGVSVPDASFNRVFILLHIFRHLFDEGVGLRQVQDYYYVLKQGFTAGEKSETVKMLKRFGLYGFAQALMYVMQAAFNIDAQYLIAGPCAQSGKFLLSEILQSGNFGHFDTRSGTTSSDSETSNFFRRMKRMIKFAGYFPSEVFCAPVFKFYNFFIRHSR